MTGTPQLLCQEQLYFIPCLARRGSDEHVLGGGARRGSSVSTLPRTCRHSGRLLTPPTPYTQPGSRCCCPARGHAAPASPRCAGWTRPRAATVRLLEGIRAGTGPLIVVVKCLRACGQPVCPAPGGGAAAGRGAVLARLLACRGRSECVEAREVSALITK